MQIIHFNSSNSVTRLKKAIQLSAKKAPVFMCVGTDAVLSDSLGPKVGTILSRYPDKVTVYGMEGDNITASNVGSSYTEIRSKHPDSTVIVIDAAVGREDQIGNIEIFNGGVLPGAATNKDLGKMGDVGIIGIITSKDMDDFYTRREERDVYVSCIAKVIAKAILRAVA